MEYVSAVPRPPLDGLIDDLALRKIWPELIDEWAAPGTSESIPAANRLLSTYLLLYSTTHAWN